MVIYRTLPGHEQTVLRFPHQKPAGASLTALSLPDNTAADNTDGFQNKWRRIPAHVRFRLFAGMTKKGHNLLFTNSLYLPSPARSSTSVAANRAVPSAFGIRVRVYFAFQK